MSEKKDIPNHWEIKTLGEVCDIQTGKYDANHAKPSGKYRFYTCAFESVYCDTNRFKGESLILPGNGANVGEVFYYNGEFDAYQRTYVLNKIKTVPKYLYYHLLGNWKRRNQDKQFGSATNYIRMANFTDYVVPLPPIAEQQAIVAKIEELFSELENGKQQLLTAQEQLKVYRQSLLKWAFEGNLTNKNVKEGELPKGWKSVNVIDIVEKSKHSLKAGPFGSTLKKEFYVQNGYKIYGQEQVIIDDAFYGDYYINEEKYLELKSCSIKPFDILISLVGTVGKVLILPENAQEGVINPRLIKITLNKEIYLHKFFKYYFESSYVKNFYSAKAQGTTMDVLNLGIIKTIPFPIPSLKEQQLIIYELESKLTICDKLEETISQNLEQAETLKQSILKTAFEGKLLN